MRAVVCLSVVQLVGCSRLLGIQDPRTGQDGGTGDDGGGGEVCHPVINELATGSAGAPADEWVEVYNPCTSAISVASWGLFYRAAATTGASDTSTLAPLTSAIAPMSTMMAPGEFRLYAGPGYVGTSDGRWSSSSTSGELKQDSGAVGLRDAGNALVDSVAYGNVVMASAGNPGNPFIEGTPTAMMANGLSASRLPRDGNDTGDNAVDFQIVTTQTPRAPNAP